MEYGDAIACSISSPPVGPFICSWGGIGGGFPARANGFDKKPEDEITSPRLGAADATPLLKALAMVPSTSTARAC